MLLLCVLVQCVIIRRNVLKMSGGEVRLDESSLETPSWAHCERTKLRQNWLLMVVLIPAGTKDVRAAVVLKKTVVCVPVGVYTLLPGSSGTFHCTAVEKHERHASKSSLPVPLHTQKLEKDEVGSFRNCLHSASMYVGVSPVSSFFHGSRGSSSRSFPATSFPERETVP